MSPVRIRDASGPWSLFLPVLLAVAGGILAADIVRHLTASAFADEADPVAAAPAGTDAANGGDEGVDEGADDGAVVTVGRSSGGDVVLLPGPATAMRDASARACINGTIALRRPNGWEQGLEDNAPLRCRASSP
jgi:hypothetical protein